jgi:hypothetical protein
MAPGIGGTYVANKRKKKEEKITIEADTNKRYWCSAFIDAVSVS